MVWWRIGWDRDQVIGEDSHRPRLARRKKKIHVNIYRIEWDRKGEIKKIDVNLDWQRDRKRLRMIDKGLEWIKK